MNKIFAKILIASCSFVALSGCYKTADSIGTAGGSLVRFPNAVAQNAIVALSGTQAGTVRISRDASDPSVINTAETVTLSVDNTLVTAAGLTIINASAYTFDASNPVTAGKITVSFAAGEFIKDLKFAINLANVPAGTSAFGVRIESATVSKTSTGSNTAIVSFVKNPFAGNYTVTGTRYNYGGSITWGNFPTLPVPAGYTATTDMSLYSPRTGTPDDGNTFEIPFGNVGSGYNYIITYNPSTKKISVSYTFVSAYSNFETSVVSLTPPEGTTKAQFHIITHYNNALAGAGADRIFDETFVQQ